MSVEAEDCRQAECLGRLFKLLSEPNRLRILCGLRTECSPVSDIVASTGLNQANVSFHLKALFEAGLVCRQRHGPFVYYCLRDASLSPLMDRLFKLVQGNGYAAGSTEIGAPPTCS